MKVLFVHAPRQLTARPDGPYDIMAISQGTFALAALLQDAGHTASIVHLGIERLLDQTFSLEELVQRERPDVVAVAIHWHQQAHAALQAAAAAKRAGAPLVVAGGITASLRYRQLLRAPALDVVIRGDAERPLLELLETCAAGGPRRDTVPNLAWLEGGRPAASALSHVPDTEAIDSLCYSRLSLLRHHDHYSGLMTHDPARGSLAAHALLRRFNLPIARGCARSCPRCGGARQTLAPATGREGSIFRNPRAVVDTMREVLAQGVQTFYVSCHPTDHDPGYYPRLFDLVRAAGLRCSLQIEAFAYLPDEVFLTAFAAAFSPGRSLVILSPHGGPARRRRVGVRYTDVELRGLLDLAGALGVRTRCHLGIGPPDDWDDVGRAVALTAELRRRGSETLALVDEVDPGAPWTRHPRRHGLLHADDELELLLKSGKPRGPHPAPGYELDQLEAKRLCLDAACGGSGELSARLHSGLPALPVRCAAWVPLRSLERISAPLDETRAWEVLVTGVSLAQAVEVTRRIQAIFPRVASLRLAAELPPRPRGALDLPPALQLDGCRFAPAPCPALRTERLLVSPDGALRPCFAAPAARGVTLEGLGAALGRRRRRAIRRRGCAACPARPHCAICLYTGPISVARYCELQRQEGSN